MVELTEEELFVHTNYGYCCFTKDCVLYNLYVEKGFRGKGLGTRLLKMAIDEIRFFNGSNVVIRVEAVPREGSVPVDDLIRFYEKHGLLVINKDKALPNS